MARKIEAYLAKKHKKQIESTTRRKDYITYYPIDIGVFNDLKDYKALKEEDERFSSEKGKKKFKFFYDNIIS